MNERCNNCIDRWSDCCQFYIPNKSPCITKNEYILAKALHKDYTHLLNPEREAELNKRYDNPNRNNKAHELYKHND